MIEFIVTQVPQAQPRQRFRVVWPKFSSIPWSLPPAALLNFIKSKVFVSNYTPASSEVTKFKDACVSAGHTAAVASKQNTPFTGAVRMSLVMVMARPKNEVWKTKPMPRYWHTKKPDTDNIAKAVQDALEGILWDTDSRVCVSELVKVVASGDEEPCLAVRVERIDDVAPVTWADDLIRESQLAET